MSASIVSSMTLSSKENHAMSLFELDAPRTSTADGLFARISQTFGNGLRALQYSRMLQALSQLPDETLEQIGIERSEIPARAYACVYGEDD